MSKKNVMSKNSKITYLILTTVFFIIFNLYLTDIILKSGYLLTENPVFDIIFLKNTGAAFNIFDGYKVFLIIFAFAAFLLLIFYALKHIKNFSGFELFFTSLLLSGILLIVLYYFVQKSRHKRKRYQQLEDTCRTLCTYSNLEHEIHWNDYQTMCDFIDLKFDHIITKLQTITTLKELDVRLCVLVLIGLPSKAIAEMMHYSPKSIGRIKENVANKLGIHGSQLRGYMLQIMGF